MKNVIVALLLLITAQLTHAELVISYRTPLYSSEYHDYYTALVKLALEKTRPEYGSYRMEGIPPQQSTLRALAELANNTYPNLLIEMGYEEKLNAKGTLTYIDFPVDGGIVGYRVCFVSPQAKAAVKQVKSLEELKKFTIGQGVGWVDTEILRANGLTVIESHSYEAIFKMVVAGRVDLFCRGANQLQAEVLGFKALTHLTYDESFALVYPLPRFFYLNSKSSAAKKRIAAGLKIAYKDGSFKQLWQEHYQSSVDFSSLKQRKIFRLKNPLIKNLPTYYEQYFFNPLE